MKPNPVSLSLSCVINPEDRISHDTVFFVAEDTVVTDSGVLTAPDFDNDGRYDNDLKYEYRVKVHDNRRIIYGFTHIDIEESDICEFDGVAVIYRV